MPGICEELLYRGFVISRLSSLFSSIVWPSLLSTAAFALTHAYQGGFGMLRAFVMGWALVAAYFWSGSLIPGMIGHALIDLLAGFYFGPHRLRYHDLPAMICLNSNCGDLSHQQLPGQDGASRTLSGRHNLTDRPCMAGKGPA